MFFFLNEATTTEIYPLSLHDALPISERKAVLDAVREALRAHDYVPILFDFDIPADRDVTETVTLLARMARFIIARSEEHTSELQSRQYLVCRLLLEKKK